MYRYRLAKRTEIRHPSFSGREGYLILDPCEDGRFWHVAGKDVTLRPEMLHLGFHHLYLQHGKLRMRMAEHFLPLLGHGVTGFRMTMKTSGLPYDGRGQLFWESIKPNLRLHGFLEPYAPPFHTLTSTSRWLRGDVPRYTTYMRSTNEAHLTVRIKMDYGPGKQYEKDFVLPRDWDRIITARHRGRDRLYYVARAASSVGWPHMDNIAWERNLEIEELFDEEARHRVLDLLGYAALHVPDGCMLTGMFISNYAGHADDDDLFSKWRNELARAAL